jgi:ABC-2 type transport system permease protein
VNGLIYRLTVRMLLRGKRPIGLAILPLLAVLLAVADRAMRTDVIAETRYASLAETLFLSTAVSIVSLVLGASSIGDERDDGSILLVVATPIPRRAIILSKLAAASTAVLVLCGPALAACIAIGLGSAATARAVLWSAAALIFCGVAYSALFLVLALISGRPVLIGLIYIVLWEGSVATFAPQAGWLSVGAYGRAMIAAGLPGAGRSHVPSISGSGAVLVLAIAVTLFAALATRRLSQVELP